MKFGIIEIGSTNTKGFISSGNELVSFGSKYIPFKSNYSKNNKLFEADVNSLYDFIKNMQKEVKNIYAFGTSIFRKMPDEERKEFIYRLKTDLNVDFKVVSADEENQYTVEGVINNIDYTGKMAVVIGGGGSTEIAIVENKTIIKKINLDFGAIDITNRFPELKQDVVSIDFNEILEYTMKLFGNLDETSDILVLAGGNYIYFYEKADYKMESNFLYKDKNQPYLLDFETADYYDNDILHKSLDEIKKQNSDNSEWWDGARGMRFCMNAVARKLKSKYIIPTKINMIIGINEEIKNKK